jgi:hypothetical protein
MSISVHDGDGKSWEGDGKSWESGIPDLECAQQSLRTVGFFGIGPAGYPDPATHPEPGKPFECQAETAGITHRSPSLKTLGKRVMAERGSVLQQSHPNGRKSHEVRYRERVDVNRSVHGATLRQGPLLHCYWVLHRAPRRLRGSKRRHMRRALRIRVAR